MDMMGNSKVSVIALVVMGLLVVLCATGMLLVEWEWWPFLLVLSSMAFVVGLILFFVRGIARAARS
jgi:hypothetical protein